jgi:hypothetical protein
MLEGCTCSWLHRVYYFLEKSKEELQAFISYAGDYEIERQQGEVGRGNKLGLLICRRQ